MSEANQTKPERKKADPKGLSPEYHRAHKQLMLWATILFIWEFVGVNLETAKQAGGNIGPVVAALKSPQAVPWVLLVLVFYFLFKCSVEWAQCHAGRRQVLFARIDYVSALIVSGAAVVLYFGQAISRVQFADSLQGSKSMSAIAGVALGSAVGMVASVIAKWHWVPRQRLLRMMLHVVPALVVTSFMVTKFRAVLIPRYLIIGILIGVSVIAVPSFLFIRRRMALLSED